METKTWNTVTYEIQWKECSKGNIQPWTLISKEEISKTSNLNCHPKKLEKRNLRPKKPNKGNNKPNKQKCADNGGNEEQKRYVFLIKKKTLPMNSYFK